MSYSKPLTLDDVRDRPWRADEIKFADSPLVNSPSDIVQIRSNVLRYAQIPDYVAARRTYQLCENAASVYATYMADRLEAEEPEVFAEKGYSKKQVVNQIVQNICLAEKKVFAKVTIDANAEVNEENDLKSYARRLYNGGDRFHPYL